MKKIVLTTLNSRYSHTAIALRYLYANLQELKGDALIEEFTINENVQSIAERILVHQPEIIGISVYIWNATEVHQLIEILKKIAGIRVVLTATAALSACCNVRATSSAPES